MTIKQFNATYLAHDDRLLFRFNSNEDSEFRFWLTRRVTLFILAATAHVIVKNLEQIHSPEAAKAIADFGKDASQISRGGDHQNASNQYQPGNHYPLGADPVLIMDAKCSLEKAGLEDLLSLDLVLPGGANMNLKMAGPLLQTMCVLLNHLREHAAWGEIPQVVDQTVGEKNIPKEGAMPSVH